MKLLIVDDEVILRMRIKKLIEDSDLPFQAILTAENAFEATDLFDKEHPEIVITDIRMPSKSGLELAAYIHEQSPATAVIVVTGYPEFEYARTALQYDVFDYLLKPIEPEKLIAAVVAAQKKLETDEKHERLYEVFKNHFAENIETIRRQYIENLLFSSETPPDADENRSLYGISLGRYRLVAIQCGTDMDTARLESEYYCTHLVEQFICEQVPGAVTYVFGGLVFFLWEIRRDDPLDDNEALLGFLRELHARVRQDFLGVLSAGISTVSDTLRDMQMLRRQTSVVLEFMRDRNLKEMLFYEDIRQSDATGWALDTEVELLTAEIGVGSTPQALARFDRIIATARAGDPNDLYSACLLIASNVCLAMRVYRGEQDMPALVGPILQQLSLEVTPEGVESLRAWCANASERVNALHQDSSNLLVNAIRDFISTNYSEPIGLTEAARHVGRNPSYISRLVRENTGESFTQLLTEKRMAEAKRLLKDTSLKVQDIAERTGYTNVRYFTRVFKANANMSPNDYRSFCSTFQ